MRTFMTVPFVALLLAACTNQPEAPTSSIEQAAQTTVFHSTWKGANASASSWSELEGAYVDVWQQNGSASLNFSKFQVDPTSQVCVTESFIDKDGLPVEFTYCSYTRSTWTNGWGQVPASNFSVKQGSARLDTAIATGPNFFVETCTQDYTDPQNPIYSCDNTVTGRITAAWGSDGRASLIQNGTTILKLGKYGYKTTGNYRAESALANGAVFGTSLVDVQGMIARNSGVSIQKDVVVNP